MKGKFQCFQKALAKPQGDFSQQILSFAHLVPEPNYINCIDGEVHSSPDNIRMSNLSNWLVANWRTRSEANEVNIEIEKNCLVYYFDTAWSPPVPCLKAITFQFKQLKFELHYAETMNGFKGCAIAIDGLLQSEHCEKHSFDEDCVGGFQCTS